VGKIKPPLEKIVQQNVRDYMAICGWDLLCDSSQGYRPEGGTRITLGFPDLLFGHPKHGLVFMECKRPGLGKVTDHQQAWHTRARNCGARVVVVDSAEAAACYLMANNLL